MADLTIGKPTITRHHKHSLRNICAANGIPFRYHSV